VVDYAECAIFLRLPVFVHVPLCPTHGFAPAWGTILEFLRGVLNSVSHTVSLYALWTDEKIGLLVWIQVLGLAVPRLIPHTTISLLNTEMFPRFSSLVLVHCAYAMAILSLVIVI
jgi:hypothetical protein